MLWIAGAFTVPAFGLLGVLFFQLKAIDVATRDTEAELRLGRQRKAKLEADLMESVAEGSPAPAEAPPGATVEAAANPS